MSDLKICRICLRTEAKVYKFDRFQLMYYYEEVMALKVNEKDDLPNYFCYECSTLLHKFHKFKEKCYRGQKALKEVLWKGPITYETIYKVDRGALHLNSPLEILKVNHKVRTYVTVDDLEDFKDEEPIVSAALVNRKRSYGSSYSDCDDNNEPEIDAIEQDSEKNDEEKPPIHDVCANDNIKPVNILEKRCSPMTIFVDEKKDLIKLQNEPVKEERGTTIAIAPNAKKYKFNSTKKHTFLDASNWKKITLSEEEAVKEFRAKADDSKYLSAAHKCTNCFKGFSKKDMLLRHTQLRHVESLGAHECRFCRMRFKWDCHLRKHMRQHFTKYECLRCHLICPLENTALLHEDYHNGIIKKCIHCGEEFRHMSTYYTHLRTHRSENVCTLCGASFVSKAGLHQHKRVKHINNEIESPDDDEDVNTHCDRCDITFETRKAYEVHLFHSALHTDGVEEELRDEYSIPRKILGKKERIRIVKELKRIPEGDDQALFKIKRSRKKSDKRLRRKPMDCHQCGKHFDTQAACMRHHLAEHPRTSFFAPAERHICEVCGASLAPGSVAMHQNMHTREKVFACDVCFRTFHSSVGLKRHVVTHTGEKPYACSLCDKRFTQSNSMKLHYRTFHLKQPYPKRNRRKKKDEPQTSAEGGEDSKSDESSDTPEPVRAEPVADSDRLPDENVHYLTLT